MAATVEQFKAALEELGGKEQGRFSRILQRLGVRALDTALADTYDAVAVNVHDNGYEISLERLARLAVPASQRELAHTALAELDITKHDMYIDEGPDGNQWVQLSLDGDPQFQRYAATRYLLDNAPTGGGVVSISAEELSLAVNGEPLAE